MNSGYYAACSGLSTRTLALDTIANNLANVSTAGFRASHNVFGSVLATMDEAPLSSLNQDENDFDVLSGTQLDTTQGALMKTGNDLDVAIEGPGYFAVETTSGTVYTRGGNFRVSPQGQLITAAGDPVLGDGGPITIVGMPVSISPDGTITSNGAISGRLQVVEFPPSAQIKSVGGSYYSAPAGAATPSKSSQVQQGMIENSNVNPITSVVEMINAERSVETMRRMLSLFSTDLDKTAAQDLPKVG
jgi:flagellar basal-body rod protein FlgF/flagellar basal-body rod protein FlgG